MADLTIPAGVKPPSALKGWRTVAINVALPAAVLLLQNLGAVDFGKLGVGVFTAVLAHSAINIALRAVTTTAIGKAT